jgi:hypothetical protein
MLLADACEFIGVAELLAACESRADRIRPCTEMLDPRHSAIGRGQAGLSRQHRFLGWSGFGETFRYHSGYRYNLPRLT